MNDYFPMEGQIKEGDIYSILYHLYKHSVSGLLTVSTPDYEKEMIIEDRKIVFAVSNQDEDAFGDHLLKNNVIDRETYEKTSQYMEENETRFGRALVELGFLNYDQIWTWIQDHLKTIVFSFFKIESGHYRFETGHDRDVENIVLDLDIVSVIVEAMRDFKSKDFLEEKFEIIDQLYICKNSSKMLTTLDLKPYELHVFDLVKRCAGLEDIVKRSELLEFDTFRLLYLFLVLEAVSTRPDADQCEPPLPEENVVSRSVFTSFDEALKHYNLKYELIYKTLSKEIGPIALSLLLKAIEDIMENLPSYFRKIQLNSDGKIIEDTIIKSLWYHDFDKNISEFLRGLEEILYTEIYAVKKHLGVDYEQQVLKWIKGVGN
jgi:hypothetical protein